MEPDKRRMEQAYDAQAPGYDSAVGRGIRALMRQLLGDLDVGEAPIALDVACGTGISTRTRVATDLYSNNSISFGRKR